MPLNQRLWVSILSRVVMVSLTATEYVLGFDLFGDMDSYRFSVVRHFTYCNSHRFMGSEIVPMCSFDAELVDEFIEVGELPFVLIDPEFKVHWL